MEQDRAVMRIDSFVTRGRPEHVAWSQAVALAAVIVSAIAWGGAAPGSVAAAAGSAIGSGTSTANDATAISGSDAVLHSGSWVDPDNGRVWHLAPVPGEWLLHFAEDASPGAADAVLARPGIATLRAFGPVTRTAIVRADIPSLGPAPGLVAITPVFRDEEGFRKYLRPERITVQFLPEVTPLEAERAIEAAGCEIVTRFRTRGYYAITTPPAGDAGTRPRATGAVLDWAGSVFQAIRYWSAQPGVRFAEPLYLGFDDELDAPDDPFFLQQWGLRNPGTGEWRETADVRADAAWWITIGDPDVVMAFVDTGMDMNHEDLAPRLLPRNGEDWDFLDPDTSPDDVNNHGTAVTGIAGAAQDNGIGVTGLAPGCRLMPLRVSLAEGQIAARVDAIQYCASRRAEFAGLIVNCSWGNSSGDFTSVRLAIQDAQTAGCVVVCAAGNSNGDVIYPARYPEPIAVGATSPCDERKRPQSCDGESWGSCFGPELDVVAPGVRIWTTDRTGNLGYSSSNYYGFFNGTSASTAFVTALAALVQSVAPSMSPEEVRAVIEQSADDEVGTPWEDTPGFDVYMGWGRINAYRALVLATHPSGLDDDIELSDPLWKHRDLSGVGPDPWHRSSVENHTEGGAWCWSAADELEGVYPAAMDAALYPPDVWVPADGELRFWHRMDAREAALGIAEDGGLLEASADGGETWFMLEPETGYTHRMDAVDGDPFPHDTPVFSGTFEWRPERVDLSPHAGAPLRIRFRFGSRADAPAEERGAGWRIDDVVVAPRDLSTLAFPAASGGGHLELTGLPAVVTAGAVLDFSLRAPASVLFSVHDASGRRLRAARWEVLAAGRHERPLDQLLAGLVSGPCWIRLESGRDRVSGRTLVVR